jgi:hypothetical protein
MRALHPYSIILGVGVGIATLATLRHPSSRIHHRQNCASLNDMMI